MQDLLPAPEFPRPTPVPLHEIPLAVLMDQPDAPPEMSETWDRHVVQGWKEMEAAVIEHRLRGKAMQGHLPGYRLAALVVGKLGIVAAFSEGGVLAGGIFDGNLHVFQDHRGRGLAAAVITLAFATGIKRPGERVRLSPGGRAVRRAAHRLAVSAALSQGIPVPDGVLRDHMAPKVKAEAA